MSQGVYRTISFGFRGFGMGLNNFTILYNMATYPVVNMSTGETKEVSMSGT